MTVDSLPPFPVDDQTLDLLWQALHPDPDAERSSVTDLCDLYSDMAGGQVRYHPNDILAEMVTEVRRRRACDAHITEAKRHLFARLIANAPRLDAPFTDEPDLSPWELIKHDMTALDNALKEADGG